MCRSLAVETPVARHTLCVRNRAIIPMAWVLGIMAPAGLRKHATSILLAALVPPIFILNFDAKIIVHIISSILLR